MIDTAPLLIDAKAVCGLLSIGLTHLHEMRAAGRFPIPAVKLGRSVRFNRTQVERWASAGCPTRWEAR